MKEAFIVDGYRTAVAKARKGGFRTVRPDDLAVHVIKYLLDKNPAVDPEKVDDIIVGNAVPEAEQGLQLSRWIALKAISKNIPGMIVNRYCASGLETISIAVAKIMAGMGDCIIAGGTESMSLVPTTGWKLAPNYDLAKENPDYFLSMGLTAEEVASDFNVERKAQDEFAYNSHKKAINAIENGYFKDQIVPVKVVETYVENDKKKNREFIVDTDEGPRKDTSMEALAKLRPVFRAGGSVTAGNSSQTNDGAAFVLVMSGEKVKELGLKPVARLVGTSVAGVDPRIMGIGPIEAVPKVLKQTGMKMADIDLIELNEAFASQSLVVMDKLGMDPEKTNVNGGAIAIGHPLACTGTKLTVQLIHELRRRKKKYGMITACVGGGQGIAGIIELLD